MQLTVPFAVQVPKVGEKFVHQVTKIITFVTNKAFSCYFGYFMSFQFKAQLQKHLSLDKATAGEIW